MVDLDRVLLSGDAAGLFLRGALAGAPGRAVPLLLAAPLLLVGSALPQARPLAARALTRLALGRRAGPARVADAYRRAVAGRPESVVAEAVSCVRRHRAAGDRVVVATGCEQTLAEGFLIAAGLPGVEVVGSTGRLWPPGVRRCMGPAKPAMSGRPRPPPTVGRGVQRQRVGPAAVPPHRGAGVVNGSDRDAERVGDALDRPIERRTWR